MEKPINYAFISYKHQKDDGRFANDANWSKLLYDRLRQQYIPVSISSEKRLNNKNTQVSQVPHATLEL